MVILKEFFLGKELIFFFFKSPKNPCICNTKLQKFHNTLTSNTLATSTLIKLFIEILKNSKNYFIQRTFCVKESKEESGGILGIFFAT